MLACASSLACLRVWPCCTIAHRTRAPVFLLHLITQVVSYFSIELLTPSPHARTPNNARNLHAASPPRVYGVSETGATYDGIVAGLGVGEGKTARRQHICYTLRSARNSVTKPCYARMTHGTGTIAFALSSTRNADEIFPRTLAHLQKMSHPPPLLSPISFLLRIEKHTVAPSKTRHTVALLGTPLQFTPSATLRIPQPFSLHKKAKRL